jgi:vitamin B12 transporter
MRGGARRPEAAILAACIAFPATAWAQSSPVALPDIVVTASRGPQSLGQTASAITVVGERELSTTNPTSVVDALRSVPGLDITETGGPGGTSSVRLRGANPGQTLVMIDGIRVNDPGAASGDFDFSMLDTGAIQRIEVLRGPQSALYGSDAIGGVVNIITRSGGGDPQFNVRTEAGRYGTLATSGSFTGGFGPWSYAFSGTRQQSDGFSRYGYRIPAIEARFPTLEDDGFRRLGGTARVGYDAGEGVRFEVGALSTWTRAQYDQASGAFPDTPSIAERLLQQAWARGSVDTLGGALTHSLQVFANQTDRLFNDVTYRTNILPQNTTSTFSSFIGDRLGTEYQGNLRLGPFGTLIYGGRIERETADTSSFTILPTPLPPSQGVQAAQETRSVFALWQETLGERLVTSLGGRVDDVVDVDRFSTWRATAAYLIPETGSKLRVSAGTGGKAPTLFQLYAPTFGNPNLQSEESFGWDGGIDQSFLNGRITFSATGFYNRFVNLIDFDITAMRYFNTARAATSGIELAAEAELWPGWARLKAAYTYMHAKDLETNLDLQRRPAHVGRVALAITPSSQWLIEPRLLYVSSRFNNANEVGFIEPYLRLDLYTEYRIDSRWRAFARLENATDTHYQEALNYGTTGRALYAGFNVTW